MEKDWIEKTKADGCNEVLTWLFELALTSSMRGGGGGESSLKSPHMLIWWAGSYRPIRREGTNCVVVEFMLQKIRKG